MIDVNLSFRNPLEYACQKRSNATVAGKFPNVGGPKHCRRLLLVGVRHRSILLYASPVWTKSFVNSQRGKQVNSVYGLMTLGVCALRTTSDVAADILVDEISML